MTFGTNSPIMGIEVTMMANYKSMYLSLFNSVTDAVKLPADAQEETESMYIENGGEPVVPLPRPPREEPENEE